MQCRHLLVIIFGLLLVGAVAKNTSAYQGLGWNKYTTTVSYYSSSARVDETVFLYGEYPHIIGGAQQTLMISSFTGIDNEPFCQLSSGCFVPQNKRLTISQISGPTDVEYELWWVGDNDGSGIPSRYASLINGVVDYMVNKISSYIPYVDLVIDSVKLLTRQDYSQSGPELITNPAFSRYIGNHMTGGMLLRVKPTSTYMLESGNHTYRIRAYSRTEIWFYEHSSWPFSKDIKEGTKIQPLGTSKYVRTISTSQSYTLTVTVIKNW